ncbi:hypothetical protein [Draconibacterium sediminis]|uniref:Uncharacterized protein n=1 Tax=Draconibacterium sediminis TaxID=1544798 RepID=A0A0D8JEV1_9BACT|nr:hypothetical protein [Draconibacterium sediminis]KJF45440.1 hypothetical protein LH29_08790 [Draconibacterium sediminis]
MCNKKTKHFSEEDFDLKDFSQSENDNSVEQEFMQSYQQLNDRINAEIPNFNPFEKLEEHNKQRFLQTKRLFAYAASILLVVSLVFVGVNHTRNEKQPTLTENELTELQENTKLALWHFSKEMNACLANLENAKRINAPLSDVESLRNLNIQFDNPIKDLKIN